ncbi:MAG: Uma2 family endonuclease [Candidatus Riflebacteria bacterium]|nr:Uma2 family endonuclease [Candidatus Riflebacteria bacterium]
MALLKPNPQERYNYKDLCDWPEGERWELIEGEPFNMTPAPGRLHQKFLVNLVQMTANFLEGKPCAVYVAPFDVRLPKGDELDGEIDTVVQPDLVVVCDKKKLDDKGCRGAPDWVVEILSPSTTEKDLTRKRDLYEFHKVREYWVISPNDKYVQVFDLSETGKYVQNRIYLSNAKAPVQVLQGFLVDLQKVFQE